ncbi:hypothetical protein [Seonamhaeicola sp.]|uniref:HlyD family efflux transporter periplasmic adaptor subunit n=1 Tax=Seonamhaeicola sp. TaxID=1912245 RepID=UPI00260C0FF9|nr:hypothetical protein [Seonamhaeicola sp.]
MKKFEYKKGKAIIRTLKEPKIKKKKFNIDRLIYFLILIGLFFWLVSFAYKKTTWIHGNGQMLMEKVDVNFTNDIRVKDIFINEGQMVNVGDTLFNYFQDDFDSDASLVLRGLDRTEKRDHDLQELSKEIQLKYIELNHLKEQLALLISREKQAVKLVLLDVYIKVQLDDIINKKLQLQSKIKLLQSEINLLGLQKKYLIKSPGGFMGTGSNYGNAYISPIKGVIGQILKNSEEACYKTENVMTIHNEENVFIKAYFNLKDIAEVKEGSMVYVEFPDNSSSKGIINKLYIATYEAPSEFQKKYEPTERNILAEIIPMNKEEIPEWGKYYKLNLKVKVSKY